MAIKKIRVSNFKSFEKIEVELGNLNVLIGPNASGKSNFIEIFKFLRDVATYGLNNALSLQGGIDYLRNVKIGSSKDVSIQITYDRETMSVDRKEGIGINPYEIVYEFAMNFTDKGDFQILKDELTAKYEFFKMNDENTVLDMPPENIGSGEINLSNIEGKVKLNINLPKEIPLINRNIHPPLLTDIRLSPGTLLLETPFFDTVPPFGKFFDNISLYDFDPNPFEKSIPITGLMELEENGTNLAIVLKNILTNKEKRRKFLNLIRNILPFIDNLEVEKFMDKPLLLKAKEIHSQRYLPASFFSDGTINIISLIIALYFEENPVIIIEEPERNIHPSLISRVMDMLKEASNKKQIIITTYNPEMVKYADLESILLTSKEKDGYSIISRPNEKRGVKTFLEHEIGIEELFIQNLLEG